MQEMEKWVPVFLGKVRPECVCRGVSVKVNPCPWHWDLLHLETGVFFQLFWLCVISLDSSNSSIITERDTAEMMRDMELAGMLSAPLMWQMSVVNCEMKSTHSSCCGL